MTLAMTRMAVLAVATAVLSLAGAAPAVGHTQLTGSSPASGSELRRAPERVRLEFNETISARFAQITLSRGSAEPEQLTPRVADRVVSADVPAAPSGVRAASIQWQVNYRVVSADGHPVTGTVAFTAPGRPDEPSASEPAGASSSAAEPSPTDVAASPSATTAVDATAQEGSDQDGADRTGLFTVVAALALAIAVGAALVVVRRLHERRNA